MEWLMFMFGWLWSAGASTPQVICRDVESAVLGGNVTLSCEFKADLDVLQVTWQRKRGKDTQNMVTYSEKYGVNVAAKFEGHVAVLNASPAAFSIQIRKLEKEDEACYVCLFNVYPNGAFTGQVYVTRLKPVNEVLCNVRGNNLIKVSLTPPEIQTRQSAPQIKNNLKTADDFTVKGQYSGTDIRPTCVFHIEGENRGKRSLQEHEINPAEVSDARVYSQCSASGTEKFRITWKNVEHISREDKVNITGGVITVTSTLIQSLSSLHAEHDCTITPDVREKADQRSWELYVIIVAVAVILISVLFWYKCYKARRKLDICTWTEAKTPKKLTKVENGPVTPCSSFKKSNPATDVSESVKFLTENDCQVIPSAPQYDGTPKDRQIKAKETLGSSIKKRIPGNSEKRNSARTLNFQAA